MSRDQVRIWGLAPNIAPFVTGCHKIRAKAALCPKIELRTIRLPYLTERFQRFQDLESSPENGFYEIKTDLALVGNGNP